MKVIRILINNDYFEIINYFQKYNIYCSINSLIFYLLVKSFNIYL